LVRELLSFLPSNNLDEAPRKACSDPVDRADEKLDSIVPDQSNLPYDMKDVISAVVDDGYFFEVQEHFAKNIVVGLARLNGRPVGIVANQPAFLAGTMDINASIKGERFANPYVAADRGFVDAVIQPRETRKKLIQALEMLGTKRDKNPAKKHGNIPL